MNAGAHGHNIAKSIVRAAFVALALVAGSAQAQSKPANKPVTLSPFIGDAACRSCHSEKVSTYLETSHYRTSSLPSKAAIHGSFAEGSNVLHTSNPYLYFSMQATPQGFFESAVEQVSATKTLAHTERMDLVI